MFWVFSFFWMLQVRNVTRAASMAHAGQLVLKTVSNVSFDSKTVLSKSIYGKYYAFDFNMVLVLIIKYSATGHRSDLC